MLAARSVPAPSPVAHRAPPVERPVAGREGDRARAQLGTLLLLSKAQLQGTVIDDLWRQYFVDRQVRQAVESLSGIEPPTDFLRLIRKRVPALSLSDVRQSLGRATLSLEYRAAQPAPMPPVGHRTQAQPTTGAAAVPTEQPASPDKTPWRHVTLRDLISSGTVRLPFDIETTYKGNQLTARIEADGRRDWPTAPSL
jgi:hypothetical protein